MPSSISIAAICADVLARTLERCSVKVEILGILEVLEALEQEGAHLVLTKAGVPLIGLIEELANKAMDQYSPKEHCIEPR